MELPGGAGTPAGNRLQARLAPAQCRQAPRALARDQGLEAGVNHRRLFRQATQAPGLAQEFIVYDQCRSHMHKYGCYMHIRQARQLAAKAPCRARLSPWPGQRGLRALSRSSTIAAMGAVQQDGTSTAGAEPIVFEQPLNERLRTFLRLDFLYSQALYHNDKASSWGSRAAMGSLLDMLAIATRGDVRSEVLKDLERHAAKLTEYQNHPGIDAARLRALMSNLIRLRADLAAAGAAWLAPLRDSEFLAAIKHRSAIPGGTCEFDLPDYYFWLNQPDTARMATLRALAGACCGRCAMRSRSCCGSRARTAASSEEVAAGGVFNVNFDRDTPYQLLRITVPAGAALYPEISGSHYRCIMRFLEWTDIDSRPQADRAPTCPSRSPAARDQCRGQSPVRPASARSSGTSEFPWRPFCSERCKLVDLGAWLSEAHAIAGEPLDETAEDPDRAAEPNPEADPPA